MFLFTTLFMFLTVFYYVSISISVRVSVTFFRYCPFLPTSKYVIIFLLWLTRLWVKADERGDARNTSCIWYQYKPPLSCIIQQVVVGNASRRSWICHSSTCTSRHQFGCRRHTNYRERVLIVQMIKSMTWSIMCLFGEVILLSFVV